MQMKRCERACPVSPYRIPALLAALLPILLVGCGENLAPVSGKVTYQGEPVKGGTLIFSPVADGSNRPGAPASATIQSDGTYQLDGGGAVVGKCKVTYTAPPGKESDDPTRDGEPSPYANLVPQAKDVEIKSGRNVIDLVLEPGPPPAKIF
ncbi:MAG TPA: hypothetical protein VFE62_24885 [Gemmataceae bacterium]|nr:hypothetical protein [Gemmataceae bacterium]